MDNQTIKAPSGDELVVLSRRDYDALMAQLGDEEAEDRMTLLIAVEGRGDAAGRSPKLSCVAKND